MASGRSRLFAISLILSGLILQVGSIGYATEPTENQNQEAGDSIESAKVEIKFSPTDIGHELKVAMEENRSFSSSSITQSIVSFAKTLAAWNPHAKPTDIASSLAARVKREGVNKGILEPTLVFIDMAMLHDRGDFANAAALIVAGLNPKMGDILTRRLGLTGAAGSFETTLPGLADLRYAPRSTFPSLQNLHETRTITNIDQILFGPGSYDAENPRQALAMSRRSPILGRHITINGIPLDSIHSRMADREDGPPRIKNARAEKSADWRDSEIQRTSRGASMGPAHRYPDTYNPNKGPEWERAEKIEKFIYCYGGCYAKGGAKGVIDAASNPTAGGISFAILDGYNSIVECQAKCPAIEDPPRINPTKDSPPPKPEEPKSNPPKDDPPKNNPPNDNGGNDDGNCNGHKEGCDQDEAGRQLSPEADLEKSQERASGPRPMKEAPHTTGNFISENELIRGIAPKPRYVKDSPHTAPNFVPDKAWIRGESLAPRISIESPHIAPGATDGGDLAYTGLPSRYSRSTMIRYGSQLKPQLSVRSVEMGKR
jgi:hypothetical protein